MLNLLEDLDKHGGFTHAFLATYNFAPGFFEDRVLPCKGLAGCPNIVIFADAGVYTSICEEPLGGRLMNRRYILVPITVGHGKYGVFHPKIWLLAGQKKARLYITSANLSRPGITTNMEIVSKFEFESDGMTETAPLFGAAYDFFDGLVSRFGPDIDTLKDCMALAKKMCPALSSQAGTYGGVTFVHNLGTPIISQLGNSLQITRTKVQVITPYFDQRLDELLNRLSREFGAKEFEIVIQQDTNTLDTEVLKRWQRKNKSVKAKVSAVQVTGRRLHAKVLLVSSKDNKPLLAFLGSTNFTGAALLSTPSQAGNIEAGIMIDANGAGEVAQLLNIESFAERRSLDLDEVRSQPSQEIEQVDAEHKALRLNNAEVGKDCNTIEVGYSADPGIEFVGSSPRLLVQMCDSFFENFVCTFRGERTTGHASFDLSPQNFSILSKAARAWLQITTTSGSEGHDLESNKVWLTHMVEFRQAAERMTKKAIQGFWESGKGLVVFLDEQLAKGSFDVVIDLLERLKIRFQAGLPTPSRHRIALSKPRSPIRDDEIPPAVWRLTVDQRKRLGFAIREFVERHYDKVLSRHVRKPDPNGLENFLDVLETCTDISIAALREGLFENDVAWPMIVGGLSLFCGNNIQEGYSEALYRHCWEIQDRLRKAYHVTRTPERIAAVALAAACSSPRVVKKKGNMTLNEVIDAARCDKLKTFYRFIGEVPTGFEDRVVSSIKTYREPGHFCVQLVGEFGCGRDNTEEHSKQQRETSTVDPTLDAESKEKPDIGRYNQCLSCAHLHNGNNTCEAFPSGIPNLIWSGQYSHTSSYKGDKGIRWKLRRTK